MKKNDLLCRQLFIEKIKRFFLLIFFSGIAVNVFAQNITVTGTVSDASGDPIPGVSVVVRGTGIGIATDVDGHYQLNVPERQSTLLFSYMGFISQEIQVGGRNLINVVLEENTSFLEEVVVVGYGSMKVKDLTSSITTIKSDELAKTPAGQAMQALQGKVAGMQVVSSGNPGTSPRVRVRGIGSYPGSDGNSGNSNPLYVVDGVFYNSIEFLNPADIATISILKDASASAIYGVRAANGVVLIETKSGAFDKRSEVVLDSYYGYQRAQNVLKMANAEQYVTMATEAALDPNFTTDFKNVESAMQRWGRSRVNPNVPDGINTDWYKEILRVAPIQNHSLDVSGGSSKAAYSVGASYFTQQGILDMKNEYSRFNLRLKVDIKATDWFKVGGNVIWSQAERYDQEGGAWREAYYAVPILPVYDPLNTEAKPEGSNYASATSIGYRNNQNPLPVMRFNENKSNNTRLMGSFFVNIDLIPKLLSFKTTYNQAFTASNGRSLGFPYFINDNFKRELSSISRSFSESSDMTWDNLLTYTNNFKDHNLSVMAGSSFRDNQSVSLNGSAEDFPIETKQTWYIARGIRSQTGYNDGGSRQYGMSYFGRISYSYLNRYILYGTYRADGSSKYQEKWGYFPTVGVAWVASEENFMKNFTGINHLKLRASWGQLGNDRISANVGARTASNRTVALNDVLYTGTYVNALFSSIKWELTEEIDFGVTAHFLKNRLSLDADYFSRDTKNAVISVTAPGGGNSVNRNVGVFRNAGLEVALNWNDNVTKDFAYQVGFNFSTVKNKVVDLYGQEYINGGTAEFRQRSVVGHPLLSFYGYEVEGVYQNAAEIAADPVAVANGLVPGDLKFKNRDPNDSSVGNVLLGSYIPTFMYGGNVGFSYKNFDFSTNIYGQAGNKILNRKRGEYIWTNDTNIDADLALNRWHGEGTSNVYPSASGLKRPWNQKMSTFYVEDGAYFRIQNIHLGYTLRNKKCFGANMPDIRLYATADRPLTLTKYNGFNPEVGNGIDDQVYPVPAVYTVGINIKFK